MCVHGQSCPILCDPMDYSTPGFSAMGFPRQEYWNGLPCSPPGDLPDPGIESASPAVASRFFTIEPSGKHRYLYRQCLFLFLVFMTIVEPGFSMFPFTTFLLYYFPRLFSDCIIFYSTKPRWISLLSAFVHSFLPEMFSLCVPPIFSLWVFLSWSPCWMWPPSLNFSCWILCVFLLLLYPGI